MTNFHNESLIEESRQGDKLVILTGDTVLGLYPSDWDFRNGKPKFRHPIFPQKGISLREEIIEYLAEFDIADCFRDACIVYDGLSRSLCGIEYGGEEFPDCSLTTIRHYNRFKKRFKAEQCSREDLILARIAADESERTLKMRLVEDARPRNGRYDRVFVAFRPLDEQLASLFERRSIPNKVVSFYDCD